MMNACMYRAYVCVCVCVSAEQYKPLWSILYLVRTRSGLRQGNKMTVPRETTWKEPEMS